MYACDPTCSIYVLPYALFLIFCCGKWYNSCVYTQCIPSGSCLSYFHYLKNYYNKLEPESRIELPTSSLPRKRSTTELPRLKTHTVISFWSCGGERRIRTFEGVAVRFTVWSRWPLGYLPMLELAIGLEPTTCWLQISCSTSWAMPAWVKRLIM